MIDRIIDFSETLLNIPLRIIDRFVDKITMYRLVLYFLTGLILVAIILGAFGALPYSPIAIGYSFVVLIAANWMTNEIFARLFKVPVNVESAYITAMILALIISPPQSGEYISILPFLLLASVVAMASKYLLNIQKKHIFNPAALGVLATAFIIGRSASWWVGTFAMLPFVLAGGILMLRKLRQFDLAIAFVGAVALTSAAIVLGHADLGTVIQRSFTGSAMVFFATVMLTEPLTMPSNRDGRIAYGILVGMLFNPHAHIGNIYFSPEMALLIGNIFAYVVSPKGRHVFTVKDVQENGSGIYDFILETDKRLKFKPGQYMEWTLGHAKPDSRGNRRYFTLASSPTEHNAVLGVKFYDKSSSYKKRMLQLKPGDTIVGGQLAGDFVLPQSRKEKLILFAGGIGVTPFRSMLKYLLDNGEQRDIVVVYSNRTMDEISYLDIFEQAHKRLNIKTVFTLTDKNQVPEGWRGYTGHINAELIRKEIPDFHQRTAYISGSHTMVTAIEDLLQNMGVHRRKIKTDFFPGLV